MSKIREGEPELDLIAALSGKGGLPTSESYFDGRQVTPAEKQRLIMARSRAKAEAFYGPGGGAVERNSAAFGSCLGGGLQPVGGRNQLPKEQRGLKTKEEFKASDKNTRGAKAGLGNQTNVDLVVFGREQDGGIAEQSGGHIDAAHNPGEIKFDLSVKEWIGHRARVGKMSTTNSMVDSIIFGTDTDGYNDISQVEDELVELPQFKHAAGMVSSKQAWNQLPTYDQPSKLAKYSVLKNASSVDEIVFGHDQGGDAGISQATFYENDPKLYDAAALPTTQAANGREMQQLGFGFLENGRPMKKRTVLQSHDASDIYSTTKPSGVYSTEYLNKPEFVNAAGNKTVHAAEAGRGESFAGGYGGAGKNPNFRSQRNSLARDMSGRLDLQPEVEDYSRRARVPGPVLASEMKAGSVGQLLFSKKEKEGNLAAIAGSTVPADGSLLAKREADRRKALAVACRSQSHTTAPEFWGAAGMPSDEMYFANTGDMMRRPKPMTIRVGYSNISEMDMHLLGRDLEGSDRDGTTMLQEKQFKGAAGGGSAALRHATTSVPTDLRATTKLGPKAVPTNLDQMDDILMHHSLQGPEDDAKQEAELREMYGDRVGCPSGETTGHYGGKDLAARLNREGVGDLQRVKQRMSDNALETIGDSLPAAYEQPGKNKSLRAVGNAVIAANRFKKGLKESGYVGGERAALGRQATRGNWMSLNDGHKDEATGRKVERARPDMRGHDMHVALQHTADDPFELEHGHEVAANPAALAGAAGRPARHLNDLNAPYSRWLHEDADSAEEIAGRERLASSKEVHDALSGELYAARDALPVPPGATSDERIEAAERQLAKTDEHYELRKNVSFDQIHKYNLLQPDEVDRTAPHKEYLRQLAEKESGEEAAGRKNFEGGVPYSTEPYEEWRKTMDYRTHMHADYERAAAKQKEARDFAGGKVTPLHNNTPWTTPVEYSEDAEWTNYPGMTRAELINMRDWTARQVKFKGPNARAPFGTGMQDGRPVDEKMYETTMAAVGPGGMYSSTVKGKAEPKSLYRQRLERAEQRGVQVLDGHHIFVATQHVEDSTPHEEDRSRRGLDKGEIGAWWAEQQRDSRTEDRYLAKPAPPAKLGSAAGWRPGTDPRKEIPAAIERTNSQLTQQSSMAGRIAARRLQAQAMRSPRQSTALRPYTAGSVGDRRPPKTAIY